MKTLLKSEKKYDIICGVRLRNKIWIPGNALLVSCWWKHLATKVEGDKCW